jgi:hypothetical protein
VVLAMTGRWVLVLIVLTIVGAFVSWFAPLDLVSCDSAFGLQECYFTEDEFETNVMRVASGAGAFVAVTAGIALLGHWIAARSRL